MARKIPQLGAKLARAEAVLKKVRPAWRRRKGGGGLSAGIKLTGGRSAERVAILVYVAAKIADADLRKAQRFPKTIRGVLIDVVPVTGRHTGNGTIHSGLRVFEKPANQGTIGLVLRRVND